MATSTSAARRRSRESSTQHGPNDLEVFKGCDAETVFEGVRSAVNTPESRTLWNRMHEELRRNGVDGAISYLEGEFTRIAESLRRELTRIEAEQ